MLGCRARRRSPSPSRTPRPRSRAGTRARLAAPADGGAVATLRRLYPADHVVGRIGVVDTAPLGRADRCDARRAALPAAAGSRACRGEPWSLPWISYRLRLPDGCPWDREQTHQSLKKHLLEEAYEVYDALDGGRLDGSGRRARRSVPADRPARPARGRSRRLRHDRRRTTRSAARSSGAIRTSSARPRRPRRPT